MNKEQIPQEQEITRIEKARNWFNADFDKELPNRIVEGPEESVLVFGSLARGEAREDSDIDLALVLPEQTDARAALRAAIGATMHRRVPLDLVVLHWSTAAHQRTMLAREVRRDGILLYGKPF